MDSSLSWVQQKAQTRSRTKAEQVEASFAKRLYPVCAATKAQEQSEACPAAILIRFTLSAVLKVGYGIPPSI